MRAQFKIKLAFCLIFNLLMKFTIFYQIEYKKNKSQY